MQTYALRVIGMVVAGLLAAGVAAAQDKIGVVDLDQALNATTEGKAARDELDRKQREARNKVQPKMDRFETLREELRSKKFVLSDDALRQKQLDLVELQNEIESELKELEGKFKVDQERIVGPLREKLLGIVQKIGREEGFILILERGTPGLLYSREALDITDRVIESFDKTG